MCPYDDDSVASAGELRDEVRALDTGHFEALPRNPVSCTRQLTGYPLPGGVKLPWSPHVACSEAHEPLDVYAQLPFQLRFVLQGWHRPTVVIAGHSHQDHPYSGHQRNQDCTDRQRQPAGVTGDAAAGRRAPTSGARGGSGPAQSHR